jgi:hypothetical protein
MPYAFSNIIGEFGPLAKINATTVSSGDYYVISPGDIQINGNITVNNGNVIIYSVNGSIIMPRNTTISTPNGSVSLVAPNGNLIVENIYTSTASNSWTRLIAKISLGSITCSSQFNYISTSNLYFYGYGTRDTGPSPYRNNKQIKISRNLQTLYVYARYGGGNTAQIFNSNNHWVALPNFETVYQINYEWYGATYTANNLFPFTGSADLSFMSGVNFTRLTSNNRLSQYYKGGSFVSYTNDYASNESGRITVGDFQGDTNTFYVTYTGNYFSNLSIRGNLASISSFPQSLGWNGHSKVIIDFNYCTIFSINGVSQPALEIDGVFPKGIEINLIGSYILGQGGSGSQGAGTSPVGASFFGEFGGTAVSIQNYVGPTINFIGYEGSVIAGGSGGGGGGAASTVSDSYGTYIYGGGGGGGGSAGLGIVQSWGSGGAGGISSGFSNGSPGSNGSFYNNSGGSGGQGAGFGSGGRGGNGGSFGSAGSSGSNPPGGLPIYKAAGGGGSSGEYVSGSKYVQFNNISLYGIASLGV